MDEDDAGIFFGGVSGGGKGGGRGVVGEDLGRFALEGEPRVGEGAHGAVFDEPLVSGGLGELGEVPGGFGGVGSRGSGGEGDDAEQQR